MSETTACRYCGAPIQWAITSNGKRMPVDVTPNPDGNTVVYVDDDEVLRAMVLGPLEVAGELNDGADVRHNHFTTCTKYTRPKGRR